MIGSTHLDTHGSCHAILLKALKASDLSDKERRGLYMLLYVLAASDCENTLRLILRNSYRGMAIICGFNSLFDLGFSSEALERKDLMPEYQPLHNMLYAAIWKLNSASFAQLEEMYSSLFKRSVASLCDPDLYTTIKALLAARNIIAHGRPLSVSYDKEGNPD